MRAETIHRSVANLANSPAVGCDSRPVLSRFIMQAHYSRINQRFLKNAVFSLIMSLLLISDYLFASTNVNAPTECTQIKSSLNRLACFDSFFKTPIHLPGERNTTSFRADYHPEILRIAQRIEAGRPSETAGLLMQRSIDHEASNQKRIILSAPAIGAYPPRPLLIISCINNITRLQIGFEKPLAENSAPVTLNLDAMSIGGDYLWRVIESGKIVDAGRGISSIKILKKISKYQRLMIQSDTYLLDGLTFDISGLNQALPELRKACHW